jgi:thiamine-monophosphate kinase
MNKEDFFIKHISNSKFIGDDGAFIDGFVYSQDAFFENIHFKKEWMSYEQIGNKAMLVNISDAVSMNAVPLYALITAAIPASMSEAEILELQKGLKKAAKKYNVQIIGGDTIANTKLDLSITIISKTDKPIYRKGLKKGQLLAYTGTLGSSLRDLNALFAGEKISANSKFYTPKLRDTFMYKAAQHMSFCMDISDGLYKELERVSKINGIGYEFLKHISKDAACSGEEYELLFGFDDADLPQIMEISKVTKTKVTVFAKAAKGSFVCDCKDWHF